jgi:hypothetical protein
MWMPTDRYTSYIGARLHTHSHTDIHKHAHMYTCTQYADVGGRLVGQRPHHFYYWLLYDRFVHAVYDVVPTEHVRHLPPLYRHALAPFRYVLTESGRVTDFSELCRTCKVREPGTQRWICAHTCTYTQGRTHGQRQTYTRWCVAHAGLLCVPLSRSLARSYTLCVRWDRHVVAGRPRMRHNLPRAICACPRFTSSVSLCRAPASPPVATPGHASTGTYRHTYTVIHIQVEKCI